MIAMRDGVKLHTVILVPKGAHNAPILLTRTPTRQTTDRHKRVNLGQRCRAMTRAQRHPGGGYIRVVQYSR